MGLKVKRSDNFVMVGFWGILLVGHLSVTLFEWKGRYRPTD
jgi:hypothetical protein